MRYGIISDIHGNLEAFEVAIDALAGERIDKFLCVGDIVGYGADPRECIEKTKALDGVVVCGNHDAACIGATDIRFFNEAAREAIVWTGNRLGQKDIKFLKGFNLVYKNRHLTLVHGTLNEPGQFHYALDARSACATFDLMNTNICFIGHSHVAGIFSSKDNNLRYAHRDKCEPSDGEKVIVNVGSVGQPRDGDPRLCYCVYDTDKNSIELKRLPYDIKKAQKKILDAGLPSFLAYRLGEGV